ncbi:MAG: hypothetical protein ACK5PO_05020 [Bacteroidota bacterium]|jgi:predicted nucleic acid-binding Zn ribbon protein
MKSLAGILQPEQKIIFMTAEERKCVTCQKPLRGRSDKKFCNEYCRNVYNNRMYSETNSYVRNINQNLRKNRKILQGFLRDKHFMTRAPQYRLFSQGFRFQFFTHTFTNRQGRQYFFCYEYGYMLIDKEKVLIIKRKSLADQRND